MKLETIIISLLFFAIFIAVGVVIYDSNKYNYGSSGTRLMENENDTAISELSQNLSVELGLVDDMSAEAQYGELDKETTGGSTPTDLTTSKTIRLIWRTGIIFKNMGNLIIATVAFGGDTAKSQIVLNYIKNAFLIMLAVLVISMVIYFFQKIPS